MTNRKRTRNIRFVRKIHKIKYHKMYTKKKSSTTPYSIHIIDITQNFGRVWHKGLI